MDKAVNNELNGSIYRIGKDEIRILVEKGVMSPSGYSLLLAENMPSLEGEVALDLGTGSGIQAVVARLRGASAVILTDNNSDALEVATKNLERNGVTELVEILPPGDMYQPLEPGRKVDTIICNPASLPMPTPDRDDSPYFAGEDGRQMIEQLIREGVQFLNPGGRIIMTHTSLADFPKTEELFKQVGFQSRILGEAEFPFRPFYNRDWIAQINGSERGLYKLVGGKPHETVRIVEATYKKFK